MILGACLRGALHLSLLLVAHGRPRPLVPLTIILASIIAVFFWARAGRKSAQLEDAQQAKAAAAALPARERKKWTAAAAAAANAVEEGEGEGDEGSRAPMSNKQQAKMQRAAQASP